MSEQKERPGRQSARAQVRANRQKNENVRYVRRAPEVSGTAYTDGMSEAYWRGIQDGESTAARMVRRADPRNVRVRSLAVISDEPEEQGLALNETSEGQMLPAEEKTVAVAVSTPTGDEQIALPESGKVTAAAVLQRENTEIAKQSESAEIPIIGLKTREIRSENAVDIMNINETRRAEQSHAQRNNPSIHIETADSTAQVTYALRREDIPAAEGTPQDSSSAGKGGEFIGKVKGRIAGSQKKRPVSGRGGKKKPDEKRPAGNGGELTVQPWKEMSVFRRVIIVLSVILFIYALAPLVLGIFNIGIIPLALIAWFFFTAALLWNHIENCRSRIVNALLTAVAFIVVLGVIGMAFISGKMIGASLNTLPEDRTDVTVVVLGCLVIEDQPSLMLERRLRTAADYLLSNPEAYCIVTGGQGENEDYPEAVVMKNYLVEAGVSEGRIIVEQNSTSTIENIEFAAELIEKYNCHEDVAIVSDRFHQYRASLAAEDAGLNSYAMPCETAWYLVAHYWFREMAGIAQIWLQG